MLRSHRAHTLMRLLLCVVLALLVSARPAYASRSSELSDDGNDYGWLYRQNNHLYLLDRLVSPSKTWEADTDMYFLDGGRWYWKHLVKTPAVGRDAETIVYPNGTVYAKCGNDEIIEAIIESGPDHIQRWVYEGPGVSSFADFTDCSRRNRLNCLYSCNIRRVVIDSTLEEKWGTSERGSFWSMPTHFDNFFGGCSHLCEVRGLEYLPSSEVVTMARMFAGCEELEEFDLTSLDTASCSDFGGMFEGCVSMTHLSLGDGWTQQGASANSDNLATFPVAMRRSGGESELYQAGDVIPDGAGQYEVADRTHLKNEAVRLSWAGASAEYGAGETLTCEYTGEEITPSVQLGPDDEPFVEGEDYSVSFADNVEEGTAKVTLRGMGSLYGSVTYEFAIEDTGAYAFLYENGKLIVKANHHLPDESLISDSVGLTASYRWFDAQTAAPGSEVPWAADASRIKTVIFDHSFAEFAPTSMAGWFAGCSSLTSVKSWCNVNKRNVTSVAGLFRGCDSLVNLELSWLAAPAATDYGDLLSGCSHLETLDLADLDLGSATNTSGFFAGCARLHTIKTGSGFRNAQDRSARLRFSTEAFCTSSGYRRSPAEAEIPSGAGEYRMGDLPIQFAEVEVEAQTFVCTGKAVCPKVTVKLGGETLAAGRDYAVSYKHNLYPGTGAIMVEGKGSLNGKVEVPFTLEAGLTKGLYVKYRTKKAVFTFKVTKVGKTGVDAEATLTGIKVLKAGGSVSVPSSCTIGSSKVTVTKIGSKLKGKFKNVTRIVIGSKVTTIGAYAFCNAPSVSSLAVKSKRLKKVTNCLAGSNIYTVDVTCKLTSSKRKKYKKWFTKKSGQDWVSYYYSG